MTKPDFIVIGAMKCATSTVCAFLEDHPEVHMVPRAEPNFFSHDDNWAKGAAWYARFFEGRTTERLCGEGSNDYAAGALHPRSAERMAAFVPDARLILMVRDPVARIASAWVQHRVDSGDMVPPTLDEAVRRSPDIYIDQSLYWRNLSRYRAYYPDDRIFIGFMEDMQRDQEAFFAKLTDFLGVQKVAQVRRGHQNPTVGKVVPSTLYTRINRLPAMAALKRTLPATLRKAVKDRLLSKPAEAAAAPSPATLAALRDAVREDAALLLAHCGKPADFWASCA